MVLRKKQTLWIINSNWSWPVSLLLAAPRSDPFSLCQTLLAHCQRASASRCACFAFFCRFKGYSADRSFPIALIFPIDLKLLLYQSDTITCVPYGTVSICVHVCDVCEHHSQNMREPNTKATSPLSNTRLHSLSGSLRIYIPCVCYLDCFQFIKVKLFLVTANCRFLFFFGQPLTALTHLCLIDSKMDRKAH